MSVAAVTWECPRCRAEFREPAPQSCSRCGMALWRIPDGWGGHAVTRTPRHARVVSAKVMLDSTWSTLKAGPLMREIAGAEVTIPSLIVVYGLPGSGKSTLAVKMVEDGTWHRPLLVAGEEGLSRSVAERIGRCEGRVLEVTDAMILPEVVEVAGDRGSDVVVLDSAGVLHVGPGEAVAMKKSGLTVIAILQSTKDGGHAGSQAWLHDADLAVQVEAMRWKVTKSWCGTLTEGDV